LASALALDLATKQVLGRLSGNSVVSRQKKRASEMEEQLRDAESRRAGTQDGNVGRSG
jgi:hypothetical protein